MPKNNKVQLPFWLLTFSLIIFLVVSQAIQDGMFMDGELYVSVSKNLANGIGTFWNPHFSKTSMSSFHEQPPLYFGLLALFYKLLGTSLYVERFFSIVVLALTALIIKKIWDVIFTDNAESKLLSWLPILLWITVPVCFWSYANNTEEIVMSLFAAAAIYFSAKALFKKKKITFYLILSGIFTFLSSLTKGPQGLFPVAAIGLFWVVNYKNFSFKKNILYTTLALSPLILIYSLLIIDNTIFKSFEMYFNTRLVSTFNNVGATTNNHFELLIRLFTELLPAFAVALIFLLIGKFKNMGTKSQTKTALWFVLIGLSGSLPLMITLEQRGFYLTTVFPYFAIAIAILIAPIITELISRINTEKLSFKIYKYSSWVLLTVSVLFAIIQMNKFKRDEELLTDIYSINKIVPHGDIINIPGNMWNEWSIQTYFNRYNYVSLEVINDKRRQFLITFKDSPVSQVDSGYTKVSLNTAKIDLYKLNNNLPSK